MTETQSFFSAVFNLVPIGSQCEICSSNDDLANVALLMDDVCIEENYVYTFLLTSRNKAILLHESIEKNIEEYMHLVKIYYEGKQLFVAYDGFEIGKIDSTLILSRHFKDEFVSTGMCSIG